MSTTTEIPIEMHTKICKKIAQLTKVIYTMNSRAEEQENIIEQIRADYDSDMQRIVLECKNKVMKFKLQSQVAFERGKQLDNLQELIKDLKDDNSRMQSLLKGQQEKALLHENQLQSDYENKYLILQNKFLEQKRDYDELILSFNSFRNEIDSKKQELINELTIKYHHEVKQISLSHETSISAVNEKKVAYETEINELKNRLELAQTQWQVEKKDMNNEHENKYAKLKSFYLKELEQFKTNNKENEKWQHEKSMLTSHFELAKSDLNNRIRFLERKVSESEKFVEKYQMEQKALDNNTAELQLNCQRFESMIEGKCKTILQLESSMAEKDFESDNVTRQLKECQMKLKTFQEENLLKVNRKDADCLKLEELLKKSQNRLSDIEFQLKNSQKECSTLQNNNKKYIDTINQLLADKNEAVTLYKNAENVLQEKKEELDALFVKLTETKKQQNMTAKNLELRFAEALSEEKKLHTENIGKFKAESEIILVESQNKLFEEFAKEKEDNINLYNAMIEKRDENLKEFKDLLEASNAREKSTSSILSELEAQLKTQKKMNSDWKIQLDNAKNALQSCKENCGRLELLLDDLKTGSSSEKNKLIEEKRQLQENLEKKFRDKLEATNNKWEEKLKVEQNGLKTRLLEEYDTTLKQIKFLNEQKIEKLHLMKDNDTFTFTEQIATLKTTIQKLEHSAFTENKNYVEQQRQFRKAFQEEKEQIFSFHTAEIEKLKDLHVIENQECLQNLRAIHDSTLETLKQKYETSTSELRNEHNSLLNTLRSQHTIEKETELKKIHDKVSSEKETLKEFLQLQNVEKIKHISEDYEKQIHEIKYELERSNELRQKEFSVHTSKIRDLVQSLEKEKLHLQSLNHKLSALEEESKTLRKELESKVEEVLEIRRECNSRMRCYTDDMSREHEIEIENLKAAHMKELQASLDEWMDKHSYLQDEVSTLKLLIEEGEERFRNRPSREEDIIFITQLQHKIMEQDMECKKLSEERKLYRLELVNREENFNKVFKTSPNVGFMNPLEQAKRRSAKKK